MDVTAIEVLCPANPDDAGRRRLWAAPAAAAWLIAAAEAGVAVDMLSDEVPDAHRHVGVICAAGARYLLLVTSAHPTLDVVRAVPAHPSRGPASVEARQQPPF